MKTNLDTKIHMVSTIMELMHREKDYHLQADLYRLTNKSIGKLLRTLEAKDSDKIKNGSEK